MTDSENDDKPWWKIPLVFIGEVFFGTLIFIIVGLPAVALNIFVHWLENLGVDSVIITGLIALEYTIFAVDVALCAFYIVKSAYKAVKEI